MASRQAALTVAALICVTIAAIGVASATDGPSKHEDDHAAEMADQKRREPKSGTIGLEGRVADPGGRAPWALRVYENADGHICTDAAQVHDGAFGEDRGASFVRRPTPEELAAGCDALQTEPFGVSIVRRSGTLTRDGGRTVVFGEVDLSSVESIAVDGPSGIRKPPLSDRGTFITVYKGTLGENPTVTVRFADGGSRVVNP